MSLRRILLPLALVLLAPLCACTSIGPRRKPEVVASFYPLQYVAQRVAGDHLKVVGLTSPGIEPHDLELSPRQVASLSWAQVVLVEKGLQPSVDDAIHNDTPKHLVDAASVVHLRHAKGGVDPHFWLDPTLLVRVVGAFTRAVTSADPAHAADYRARAAALTDDLSALDGQIRRGLTGCRTRDLVVSHDAFEYFGRQYGLDVHPISGLSPDAEPSAKHLTQLADLAEREGVTTVFNETLASPELADTLASDLGLRTAVLDPIESLASRHRTDDYLSVQRRNLAALQEACR